MHNMQEAEPMIKIDRDRCIGCLECIDICPQVADLEFPVFERGIDGYPKIANEESCIRCLSCEFNCRAEAIRVEAGGAGERYGPVDMRAKIKCGVMF